MSKGKRIEAPEKKLARSDQPGQDCIITYPDDHQGPLVGPEAPPCGWHYHSTLDGCLDCRIASEENKYIATSHQDHFPGPDEKNDGYDWTLPSCDLFVLKGNDGRIAEYYCRQRQIPWSVDLSDDESEICPFHPILSDDLHESDGYTHLRRERIVVNVLTKSAEQLNEEKEGQ